MSEHADVLIVGAGQAGAQAAMALRQQKYEGSIVMLGAEPELPYERPALSKEYLAGEKAFEKMLLRPATFWAEKKVDVRTNHRVVALDAEKREIRTHDGSVMHYGTLVWGTGGRPRRLPCAGSDLAGVHTVRDRADVDRMRAELEAASAVVVVGGGYIGLESAAVLRKKEKRVTVLEAQARVLSRVAGEPLSRFYEAEHRARGVDVRLGAAVTTIEGRDGRVSGVRLSTGEVIAADIVVVGIGIAAEIDVLAAAGARTAERGDGIVVDLVGRTSLRNVFAAGDCAAHPNVYANGRTVRLESIQNANDQATVIAKAIAGTLAENERYDGVPWFWSNQWELRLQTVGLFHDHDDIVVRGDPADKSFSVVYLRDGAVIAADCVNKTKDYVQAKALITSAKKVDRAKLADATVILKELA